MLSDSDRSEKGIDLDSAEFGFDMPGFEFEISVLVSWPQSLCAVGVHDKA